MRYNIIETLMAAIVLIVTVGFLTYVARGEQTRAIEGYLLQAAFAQTGGLRLGDDIRTAGLRIGTVTDLSVDSETLYAIVGFTIPYNIGVPVDSCLAIRANGLLGGQHAALIFGQDSEILPPGGMIERTVDANLLLDEISKVIYGSADMNVPYC